jgi:hypothetical protein
MSEKPIEYPKIRLIRLPCPMQLFSFNSKNGFDFHVQTDEGVERLPSKSSNFGHNLTLGVCFQNSGHAYIRSAG